MSGISGLSLSSLKIRYLKVWEDFISKEFDVLVKGFQDDHEEVEVFQEYFERTWLGSMNTRTLERRAPLFAHSLWNKYQENVLTSNAAEETIMLCLYLFPKMQEFVHWSTSLERRRVLSIGSFMTQF